MTESAKRRRRLSRGALRAIAWIAGGVAFATPFASLTIAPKPATAKGAVQAGRRVIIVRKITRRVIVRQAPDAGVRYVYAGGGSSGGSGPSGGGTLAASAPSSTTSTGGS